MARARALIRPVKTSGALIVNPKRKNRKHRKNGASRRSKHRAPRLLANRRHRHRKNKARKASRRHRKNPLAIRVRRNRYAGLAIRTNPKRRKAHRKHRRNPLAIRVRRNGKHRRNPSYSLSGKGIGKQIAAFLWPAGFGAAATEPLLMVADLAARYFPTLPTSAVYAGAGVITGVGILMVPVGSKEMREKLAIGAASAGGALGYFHWRTNMDAPVAASMSGIRQLGYASPVDLLTGPSARLGGFGPEMVQPMGRQFRYPVG